MYEPSQPNKKLPVVIFFYGGNWASGDKADYKFVAEALTSNGFVTVIPDYRVFPEVTFPGFMADPASAEKWVKNHIFEYGGDPNRIFLVGHSAGHMLQSC
ncbi:MAG: alpha/beta hydrolase [Methylotenera sp.]